MTFTKHTSVSERRGLGLSYLLFGAMWALAITWLPDVQATSASSNATMGLLLTFASGGGVLATILSSRLVATCGAVSLTLGGQFLILAGLNVLPWSSGPVGQGGALLIIGAGLGAVDVGVNVWASHQESSKKAGLFSTLHGFASLGSLMGAGLGTALGGLRLATEWQATLSSIACLSLIIAFVWPFRATHRTAKKPEDSESGAIRPEHRAGLLVVAIAAGIIYLNEGVVMEWSTLFATTTSMLDPEWSGLPLLLYTTGVAATRLLLVPSEHTHRILYASLSCAALSVFFITVAEGPIVLLGFLAAGVAYAPAVPRFFYMASQVPTAQRARAVAWVSISTAIGYLTGPALFGSVVAHSGISFGFFVTGVLSLAIVALLLATVSRRTFMSAGTGN